jgi:hypothetical protein
LFADRRCVDWTKSISGFLYFSVMSLA